MAEPKIVDFKPRWMRNMSDRDRAMLAEAPLAGVVPPSPPRITARVVSSVGASGISSRTLIGLIEQTQAIVSHAGCDLYYGFDPDFTDLRSASAEVQQLTQLTIEPGEEGSYVLSARLDAAPAEVIEPETRRQISTEDVVRRFTEILTGARDQETAGQISLGALRAIEGLERLVQREASLIEYQPMDAQGRLVEPFRVDAAYLERVSKARVLRQPTRTLLETLTGMITALDLEQETLQLTLEGSRRRVKGTFSRLLHPVVLTCLGRHVRLQGQVTRRGRAIQSISVQRIDPVRETPGEESA